MRYLIIPASRVPELEFAHVKETGPAYLRYNNDNSKTFVKWSGDDPASITKIVGITTLSSWGPYDRDEFLEILKNDEWSTEL